eukprot:g53185.t1
MDGCVFYRRSDFLSSHLKSNPTGRSLSAERLRRAAQLKFYGRLRVLPEKRSPVIASQVKSDWTAEAEGAIRDSMDLQQGLQELLNSSEKDLEGWCSTVDKWALQQDVKMEFPRWVAVDDAHYNLLRRRLLSCNNRLRLYRSKLVSGMSPRCFCCHDDVNESLAHFLWDCPMHEGRRKQLLLSMQRLGGMAVGGAEGDGGSEEGGEVVGGEVVVEDVLLGREREGSARQGWDDMSPVDQSRLFCKLFQGKSRFRSNFRLAALLGVTALRPPSKLDVLFGSYVSECWSAREGKREELGVDDGGEEVIDLTEVPSASVPPSPPSDVDVARRGRPRSVDVLARERGSGAQRSVSEFFSSANTLASSS